MKTIKFKHSVLALLVLALLVGGAYAQPGAKGIKDITQRGPTMEHFPKIPDLTEKQQEEMKKLQTDHMKEMLPLKNQIREKEAHLLTISTGDNVDMKKVNSAIEEIGALKIQMEKKRAAHRQEIRNLLTDEQRVIFDSHPQHPRGIDGRPGRPERDPEDRMPRGDRF